MSRRGHLSRSDAAKAATRELGEGKFFRTKQDESGNWSWHYEPGECPASMFANLEFVAWVESDWDRSGPEPVKKGVCIVTCRLDELPDDFAMAAIVTEPITPELFEDPKAKPEKAARSSTGERAKSDVENPTKLVWRLADEMTGATRADVVAACIAQGVNKATASTQYYRWQKAQATST